MASKTGGGKFSGTVAIDTHGCKLNQADSEVLARQFIRAGYLVVDVDDGPDVYVLNTCTVTHMADSKARQALRAARRKNPQALVVATGCYAQRAPADLMNLEEVRLVAGNRQKGSLVDMVLAERGETVVPCSLGEEPKVASGTYGRTRAMIKIQEGCNQVCAYCIVPKVRGRERSIPTQELLQQIQQRVAEGYKEVVLTGTQLGSYGFDIPQMSLETLLGLILARTSVKRIRISSLQPQEVTPGLLQLWDDARLCPHFHMPLQSGSDGVLRRMRRRYTTSLYRITVERVHQILPHAAITSDVIVGFPGESQEEFEETLRFCESIELADMHVFPYSVRPRTSAAYMGPKVNPHVKRGRMEGMLALAKEKASAFRRRFIGTTRLVLWERMEGNLGLRVYTGRTDNYLKVRAHSAKPLTNRIAPARLLQEQGGIILSEGILDQEALRVPVSPL